MDFSPFWISIKVAACATAITFAAGLAAARLVMLMKRGKGIVDGLFSLPMVLPPTVVGFFLLMIFGTNGMLGGLLASIGMSVVFTWQGAVIAAAAVSFPIMYRTARGALEQVDENLINAGRTLGMSESRIFFKILLPMSRPGIAAAAILSFARALGEFGATMMLAGNIPGRTQTMSIAIYTAMQGGNREKAYVWVAVIMAMSFGVMILMNLWNDRQNRRKKI
ncbi:MAG TPA: molybdate ABC transporter permease subunit [Candidatus Fimisoma avicola]|mgnify:FL=1|uniref:Molybdenum transport system permease n=1 Tax=Candidatus Fimisoma avicola TaxID=2840826 RepID=A0A9D1L991_9FIRM|nr:molybdate ABC transporter permease subunit [Candidatus Fimisoma avicola]